MSFCEDFNCGYYYKGENDDFACCHCDSLIAPCEEEDEDYEEEDEESFEEMLDKHFQE